MPAKTLSRPLLPWITVFLLSALAWISVFQQSLSMYLLATPAIGTMGLPPGSFVLFWTIMMVAMMFPALAPTLAMRYQYQRRQSRADLFLFFQMLTFLSGYLLIWTLSGIPVFWLAELEKELAFHVPELGLALGIVLLLVIGFYQMTPLAKYYLTRCNVFLCCDARSSSSLFSQFREGLRHGLHCLGCCGGLMLVMEVVGLMNLPWMILLTVAIFLEKTWHQGERLSFFVGFSLLIFAMLALAEPALLAGVYLPT